MVEMLLEYALFLAKTLTVVIAIVAVIAAVTVAAHRERHGVGLRVQRLNERFDKLANTLRAEVLPKKTFKATLKRERKARKAARKADAEPARPRVFVLDFKGDIRASATRSLREEVSAVVASAESGDEVLLRLENAGGIVHDHGFAASQLVRLKSAGLTLTVAVDKIAASGGYMMACVADRIVAAPFAVLGSIGVLAQLPNFHRLLESKGVDFEQFKGGRFKRTVTVFGENTEADRKKFQQEIDDAHALFQRYVSEHRPALDIAKVATGEHWFGREAMDLGLCDALGTSDDWLMQRRDASDLLHVSYAVKPRISQRLARSVEDAAARVADTLYERLLQRRAGP